MGILLGIIIIGEFLWVFYRGITIIQELLCVHLVANNNREISMSII